MAHHSGEMSDQIRKLLDLGATGEFPHGKLYGCDEGEIRVAIAADVAKQVVVIDFGKPTAWIGFTGEQAEQIADMLHVKALELRGIRPT